MKLVQIAGYLGSGKTTLVIALSKGLSRSGLKVAILVNEIGEIPVDGKVIEDYGFTVKDIGGGCICCQIAGNLTRTLRFLGDEQNPDLVIIEPTGMAVPGSIRETVEALNIDIGPTIVLFDTTRSEKLLNYETLKRLISTQIRDADFIALSKIDKVSEDVIEHASEAVSVINPAAGIIRLSTRRGDGVMTLATAVQEVTIKK